LAPRRDAAASAHISWLSDGIGIIYLDDLMPQLPTKNQHTLANISLELPNGWQVSATEKRTSEFVFKSINVETSVLLIGQNLRGRTIISGSHSIGLVIGGRWQFSDDEAAKIAKEIYDDYRDLFGADASGQAQIALLKFPVPASTGQWEASTIGSSVTILSEDMPFKTQSLQRLHEQLRHEIFHLWIPNGINLKGNYDWFYEGFALYASLKNGVRLNRIGFEDFLDTLSRARTIDSFQNPRLSLIDASQNRWSGGNTTVYSRGMIVAFLCDLALLNNSKGKTNVSDLLKEIFEKYQYETGSIDGTETVLRALDAHTELQPIVEKYIKGKSVIDWDVDVSAAGIVSEEKNSVTVLKPTEKPNARQKVLLDRLGYNSWRRIGTK
jgi:predicted metalloprotease with PDZ domain